MNGHPRDQANVSVHCRWPLIRGTDGHVEMSRDIDNVAVHSRWPLTTGSPKAGRGNTGYMGCRALWEIVVSAE